MNRNHLLLIAFAECKCLTRFVLTGPRQLRATTTVFYRLISLTYHTPKKAHYRNPLGGLGMYLSRSLMTCRWRNSGGSTYIAKYNDTELVYHQDLEMSNLFGEREEWKLLAKRKKHIAILNSCLLKIGSLFFSVDFQSYMWPFQWDF